MMIKKEETFMNDHKKLNDFLGHLNKKEFLNKYTDISEEEYENTEKYLMDNKDDFYVCGYMDHDLVTGFPLKKIPQFFNVDIYDSEVGYFNPKCNIRLYDKKEYEKIQKVDPAIISYYIDCWQDHKPLPTDKNLLYAHDNGVFVALDNRTGDCWVEEFKSEEQAIDWLILDDIEYSMTYEQSSKEKAKMKEDKMQDKVYTFCYNNLDVFPTKKAATDFYKYCFQNSEGAEAERYSNILIDLMDSNEGYDGVTREYDRIFIKNDKGWGVEEPIQIFIDSLSRKEAVEFYENKVQPILNESEGIDFRKETPFEYYGSDEESDYMASFSKYYELILTSKGYNVDSIITNEISDGKYEMIVNNDITIDVRAWDKINDVIDNVDSIENELVKSKESEVEL